MLYTLFCLFLNVKVVCSLHGRRFTPYLVPYMANRKSTELHLPSVYIKCTIYYIGNKIMTFTYYFSLLHVHYGSDLTRGLNTCKIVKHLRLQFLYI